MEKTPAIHFRRATLADLPALRALIEASVRGLVTKEYTPAQVEGCMGHALGLDTQLVGDGTYYIAELDTPEVKNAEMLGCGGWSYRRTLFGSDNADQRESSLLDPATDAAKIRAIFVHPAWARRGIGTAILAHCEHAAQMAGFSRVEMGSTLTGVPLYTLKGYAAQKNIEVPLPNGEVLTVVHMTKVL